MVTTSTHITLNYKLSLKHIRMKQTTDYFNFIIKHLRKCFQSAA